MSPSLADAGTAGSSCSGGGSGSAGRPPGCPFGAASEPDSSEAICTGRLKIQRSSPRLAPLRTSNKAAAQKSWQIDLLAWGGDLRSYSCRFLQLRRDEFPTRVCIPTTEVWQVPIRRNQHLLLAQVDKEVRPAAPKGARICRWSRSKAE